MLAQSSNQLKDIYVKCQNYKEKMEQVLLEHKREREEKVCLFLIVIVSNVFFKDKAR